MAQLFKRALTGLTALVFSALSYGAEPLTLASALEYAKNNEPWLEASRQRQSAMEAKSQAAGTLPDPVLALTLANLATDGFAFNSQDMSQFKLGLTQQFARGDSLAIRQRQLATLSEVMPFERAERLAWLETRVSEFWLNAYRAQQSIVLIEQDKQLFTQLLDLTQASYSASAGNTRQQDIIRAQLELTRLDGKLMALRQASEAAKKRLAQWLPYTMLDSRLAVTLPEILPKADFALLNENRLLGLLNRHPAVRAIDKKLQAGGSQVELARQGYKPKFGVSVNYGYRADRPGGESRADLLSVGLSMDLPLFSDSRQEQQVRAAIAEREAIKTEKRLLIHRLKGQFLAERDQLQSLKQREALYRTQLLEQMSEQVAAVLNAYTHDNGDFSEVMRARIAELEAKLDVLNIRVDQAILLSRLNYFAAAREE